VQTVIRHGSRALSGPDDDVRSLALWRMAAQTDGLTALGRELGPLLEAMQDLNRQVGYGNITTLGVNEQRALARRLLQRHAEWAAQLPDLQQPITVYHSGRDRADQSADAFIEGLLSEAPGLAPLIQPPAAAPDTLYFHSAEGSADYRAYRKDDQRLRSVLQQIQELPATRAAARQLLAALYTPAFLDRLAAGEIQLAAPEDPEGTLARELDAAQRLYGLYAAASNLVADQRLDFGRFIDPEALVGLAYVDDAETFYERGPGFAGDDVSYRGAAVLVEELLHGAEQAGEPDAPALVLRFTHAQALIPLAVFLGIPGSSEPLPESTLYDYRSSAWRSERTTPMSANVQWDVYQMADGARAVRMLQQEAQLSFASVCQPLPGTRMFYALAELRRCLIAERAVAR
jgi:hypothetical protein